MRELGRLRVVAATRADVLAEDLAQQLESARVAHFDRCVVAVNGPGLGRWLRRFMAHHMGAWGGVETPFLRSFLLELSRARGGVAGTRGRDDIAGLRFHVASAMVRAWEDPAHPSHGKLRASLSDQDGGVDHGRLLSLALKVAEAFDRYEVDRPEVLASWQRGEASGTLVGRAADLEAWQRPLWSAVATASRTHQSWDALRQLVLELEGGEDAGRLGLPAFISVFGVSTLPDVVVRTLKALSRHTRVSLHLLSPAGAFSGQAMERRRLVWAAVDQPGDEGGLQRAAGLSAGHPLLDLMGRQAVEAQQVLGEAGLEVTARDGARPASAARDSLLARVQQGLRADQPIQAAKAAPGDRSVHVHSVATLRRAAEIIHDEILGAFASMDGLRPDDVAILTPDLPGMGRAIESVFTQSGALPLTNADPGLACPSDLVVALQAALSAAAEGLPLERVLDLLRQPCVQAGLGVEQREADDLMWCLEAAAARRFADSEHRSQVLGREAVADDRLHTLEWAVDRVVLGTVAGSRPADEAQLGENAGEALAGIDPEVLPAASMGSASLEALQGVVACITTLASLGRGWSKAKPLAGWCEEIERVTALLLPPAHDPAHGEQRMEIDRGLQALRARAQDAGFDQPVTGDVAASLVLEALRGISEGMHYAEGGITLARLAPMRSIPFRVIVLAGLEPGVFPRPGAREGGVDIVHAAPHAGDRSPREEDLALFLECLHAARERLLVVSLGIDPRTGTARPFCSPVDQLLDACADHLGTTGEAVRKELVTVHAMRSDEPEAWLEMAGARGTGAGSVVRPTPARFNHKARTLAEAARKGRGSPETRAFLEGPLEGLRPPQSWQAWQAMIRDPGKAFLKQLGVQLPDPDDSDVPSGELVDLDALQLWHLERSAFLDVMRGTKPEAWMARTRREGRLPHGARARVAAKRIVAAALEVRASIEKKLQDAGLAAPGWRTRSCSAPFRVHDVAYAVTAEVVEGTQACVVRSTRDGLPEAYQRWIDWLAWAVAAPGQPFILVSKGGVPRMKDHINRATALQRLEWLHDIATAGSAWPLPIHPRVLDAWASGPDKRAEKLRVTLYNEWTNRPLGLMLSPIHKLVYGAQTWNDQGPTIAVGGGRRSVHAALDALAAAITGAMRQDGWWNPRRGGGD